MEPFRHLILVQFGATMLNVNRGKRRIVIFDLMLF